MVLGRLPGIAPRPPPDLVQPPVRRPSKELAKHAARELGVRERFPGAARGILSLVPQAGGEGDQAGEYVVRRRRLSVGEELCLF